MARNKKKLNYFISVLGIYTKEKKIVSSIYRWNTYNFFNMLCNYKNYLKNISRYIVIFMWFFCSFYKRVRLSNMCILITYMCMAQ